MVIYHRNADIPVMDCMKGETGMLKKVVSKTIESIPVTEFLPGFSMFII